MCLLLCIGTAAAADLYQIVLNMLVSVQYKPRNLQNAYAVSELSQQMCYRYQGVVTYIRPVEAFATGIKNLDR